MKKHICDRCGADAAMIKMGGYEGMRPPEISLTSSDGRIVNLDICFQCEGEIEKAVFIKITR